MESAGILAYDLFVLLLRFLLKVALFFTSLSCPYNGLLL